MAAPTYTYRQQHRPFPSSSNTLTIDGSPLHTRLGLDMITSINNLAYRMPFVGYAQSYNTYPLHTKTAIHAENVNTTVAAEWFAAQLPTVFPRTSGRFCWTLGLLLQDGSDVAPGDSVQSLDAVSIYVSHSPYSDIMCIPDSFDGMQPSFYRAFDRTKVGSPYGVSTKLIGSTFTSGDAAVYVLVDNSDGTPCSSLPLVDTVTDGGLADRNLIITTTAHETMPAVSGTLLVTVQDFTWWLLPVA